MQRGSFGDVSENRALDFDAVFQALAYQIWEIDCSIDANRGEFHSVIAALWYFGFRQDFKVRDDILVPRIFRNKAVEEG